MLVSTPGFQQIVIKDMGNVGRHTWISADNDKKTWEMMVGTPGSQQIMI